MLIKMFLELRGGSEMEFKKFWPMMFVITIVSFAIGGLMVFGADSNDAAAYFPLKTGNMWIYKVSMTGVTNSFSQRIKVTDPENGNPKIIVYDPKDNPLAFISYLENDKGIFKVKQMSPAGVEEYKPLWQVLSSKMNVGATWGWESGDHKMKETSKVLAMEKITILAGTFETMLIQCEGVDNRGSAYVEKTWYAKGVGYVKDENTTEGKTYITELSEYQLAN
jgi:hypothetical protein